MDGQTDRQWCLYEIISSKFTFSLLAQSTPAPDTCSCVSFDRSVVTTSGEPPFVVGAEHDACYI